MHIPDGMLETRTWVSCWAAATGLLAYAIRWVRRHVSQQRVVLMAVMAALVFALQMLNFPVAGGTSGHFAGGAAAAILLGPWPAMIVLTTVLIVQAVLFADGGITALGANIVNMAVIGPFVGYAIWRMVRLVWKTRRGLITGAFAAAWFAAVVSALMAAIEIWLSGRAPFVFIVGTMGFWHALTGIGEGVITAGLVGYVLAVRPDLVEGDRDAAPGSWKRLVAGLGIATLVAAGLSVWASRKPDALEFVSAQRGLAGSASGSILAGAMPRYLLPGVADHTLAGVLAAIVGLTVAGVVLITVFWRRPSQRDDAEHAAEDTTAPTMLGHGHAHDRDAAHRHPHHHTAPAVPIPDAPARQPISHAHAHPMSFERLTYVVSPVHDLDPRAKIIAALVLIGGVVLTQSMLPREFVLLVALLATIVGLARLPLAPLAIRSALVLPIAGTIALVAPAQATLTGTSVAVGWLLAWTIVSKAWLSASIMLLVAATTPPARLFTGLRALHLPDILLTMLTFLYRYADSLGDQLRSMHRAVASRGAGVSGRRLVALYGNLAGTMFIRAYERGERVHASMLSRGYDGSIPTGEKLRARPADALALCLVVLATAAIILY